MALSEQKVSLRDSLLAIIADRLGFLVWAQTVDGQHNRNRPSSIYDALQGQNSSSNDQLMCFRSGADFDAYWKKITNGGG